MARSQGHVTVKQLGVHPRGPRHPCEMRAVSRSWLEAGSFKFPPGEDCVRCSGPPAVASGEVAVETGRPVERVGSSQFLGHQQQGGKEARGVQELESIVAPAG